MDYLSKAGEAARELTSVGLSVLSLGVVLQVLFGKGVPFFPGDIIGTVTGIVNTLGSEGLVGLVSIWVLLSIFNRKES